jgi:hypothetical protein
MAQIELPRPLEHYFAFAELAANRQGRRFTLTFPYFDGERLDRLQWWWQLSAAQERIGGESGVAALRHDAADRFRQHIERWLEASGKRLFDGAPFPRLAVAKEAPVPAAADDNEGPEAAWFLNRVSNG